MITPPFTNLHGMCPHPNDHTWVLLEDRARTTRGDFLCPAGNRSLVAIAWLLPLRCKWGKPVLLPVLQVQGTHMSFTTRQKKTLPLLLPMQLLLPVASQLLRSRVEHPVRLLPRLQSRKKKRTVCLWK